MKKIRGLDLFCGAGGSSWGAHEAGVEIVAGFDIWETAGKVYQDNFPEAKFYSGDIDFYDLRTVKSDLGKIDLVLASPECTNHSPAKGNKPRCEKSRETAFYVKKFAKYLKPKWIVIENVIHMKSWSRYDEFKLQLSALGYHIRECVLNSSDFGVPQRRIRLFLVCSLKSLPKTISISDKTHCPASSIVDTNETYAYSPLYTERRANATIERAERAIDELGSKTPFLLVYYGTDHGGGWQSLDEPLRTVTTRDRFALVKPGTNGHIMRMLQVPELKKAMGLPDEFKINNVSRQDGIKMLGNGVCPPVMKNIIDRMSQVDESS